MKLELTHDFKKDLKYLLKKYPSLTKEILKIGESLKVTPFQGTPIGGYCYKIRLNISSKSRGKSGGARIITYVHVIGETVYLLSIYDKSDQENISEKELKRRLENL